ncbi:TonB-dependent receptor [bacterium]|nr:TonB-dependent receptor [bacterium]
MIPRAWLALIIVAPLACPALIAWAQDGDYIEITDDEIVLEEDAGTDADESTEIDLGAAEVLGERSLASIVDDARALTVIEAEAFAGATTAADVLERVPGTDVRQLGGSGQLSTALIRGARSEQVLVLVDGAPLAGEAADLSLLSLGALARVEVLRGPKAARFGPGALGGVINLVTAEPEAGPAAPEPDAAEYIPLLERTDLLGKRNGAPAATTEFTITGGGHNSLETALAIQTPGASYYLSHLQARNDYSYERAGGQAATRHNNEATQQSCWANWMSGGTSYRAGIVHARRGVPGMSEYPTLAARLARDGVWLQAREAGWRTDLSVLHTHFTDPAPYLNRGAIDTQDTRWHLEHAWGAAANGTQPWGFKPRLDYIDSDASGRQARAGLDAQYNWRADRGRFSLFADTGLVASSDIGVDPVARLAAEYNCGGHTTAYAAAGYAVRHPSFSELYYADTGGMRGNPELTSERLFNYELGLDWTGEHARLELAGFYSDYRDSIVWAPVSAYTVAAINTGPASVAGAEALLDVELAEAVWWRTAGTWLPRAEYDSGVPLTGRSEYHANSRLEYTGAPWRGAFSLDYTGEIPADLFGSLVIEPRTLYGLELAREFDNFSIALSISNLFDTQARDAWNYPLPGREVLITWNTQL